MKPNTMNDHRTLKTNSTQRLPLALSRFSAGSLAEMSDEFDLLDINELITGGREGFAACILTGLSMIEEIRPGAVVFYNTLAEPRHGNIVISSVNGLNNVKVFETRTNGLYLVPRPGLGDFQPHRLSESDDFSILGVVVGHLSMY